MNNDISILTGQPVAITLGGKSYQAKRATLSDIGKMNTFKDQQIKKGETANLEIDSTLFLLSCLMSPYNDGINYQTLAEMIPVDSIGDLSTALEIVGFKKPQGTTNPMKTKAGE